MKQGSNERCPCQCTADEGSEKETVQFTTVINSPIMQRQDRALAQRAGGRSKTLERVQADCEAKHPEWQDYNALQQDILASTFTELAP